MTSEYSTDAGQIKTFGTLDYVLFSVFLCTLAAIGFYHAYWDRKKTSSEDFHFWGRKMHPVPVALSLAVSFLSSLTIIGTPAEIYTNGTMFYFSIFSQIIGSAAAAHIFVPVFYKLKTTSCFQYIDMRFGRGTKVITSVFYMIQGFVYMGFVLYVPSLAFQAVTRLSFWGCMVGVSVVCILYTALGGMKSVLWTNLLEVVIMSFGILAEVIEGSAVVVGLGNAWEIARQNGRIEFDNVSFDPRIRHSIWNVTIGFTLFWTYLYGVNQAQVQRACSLSSLRKAQIAIWLNVRCADSHDAGMSTRYCHVMSSSGLNAMSAVILHDYVKPISRTVCRTNNIDRHEIIVSKMLVITSGFIQFGFAGLLTIMPGLIVTISLNIYSLIAGPILGVFLAGMFFRWTNKFGAISGFLIALAFMCWVGIGTLLEKPAGLTDRLPIYTDECFHTNEIAMSPIASSTTTTATNLSLTEPLTTATATKAVSALDDLYRLSYTWYTGLGMIVCIFFALIVSLVTNCFIAKPKVNSKLQVPVFDILLPCLPEHIRNLHTRGVVYNTGDEDEEKKDAIKSNKTIVTRL